MGLKKFVNLEKVREVENVCDLRKRIQNGKWRKREGTRKKKKRQEKNVKQNSCSAWHEKRYY